MFSSLRPSPPKGKSRKELADSAQTSSPLAAGLSYSADGSQLVASYSGELIYSFATRQHARSPSLYTQETPFKQKYRSAHLATYVLSEDDEYRRRRYSSWQPSRTQRPQETSSRPANPAGAAPSAAALPRNIHPLAAATSGLAQAGNDAARGVGGMTFDAGNAAAAARAGTAGAGAPSTAGARPRAAAARAAAAAPATAAPAAVPDAPASRHWTRATAARAGAGAAPVASPAPQPPADARAPRSSARLVPHHLSGNAPAAAAAGPDRHPSTSVSIGGLGAQASGMPEAAGAGSSNSGGRPAKRRRTRAAGDDEAAATNVSQPSAGPSAGVSAGAAASAAAGSSSRGSRAARSTLSRGFLNLRQPAGADGAPSTSAPDPPEDPRVVAQRLSRMRAADERQQRADLRRLPPDAARPARAPAPSYLTGIAAAAPTPGATAAAAAARSNSTAAAAAAAGSSRATAGPSRAAAASERRTLNAAGPPNAADHTGRESRFGSPSGHSNSAAMQWLEDIQNTPRDSEDPPDALSNEDYQEWLNDNYQEMCEQEHCLRCFAGGSPRHLSFIAVYILFKGC